MGKPEQGIQINPNRCQWDPQTFLCLLLVSQLWFKIWTASVYKYIYLHTDIFIGTVSCISQCQCLLSIHSWTSPVKLSAFSCLDYSFICSQRHWTSLANNVDPWGQELRTCSRRQGPGWHHACMKKSAPLGQAWAVAKSSYRNSSSFW